MDIPVRVVGQYHIVAKVDELIPRLPGLIRAGNGPEHEESESLAATLVRANLRRMAMDGLDYWRLCDEVNVIQAAHWISSPAARMISLSLRGFQSAGDHSTRS